MIQIDEERMAEIQHDIWSGWMRWLFKCGRMEPIYNGFVIPEDKVKRWTRQLNTDYKDLPENEKDGDRKVVQEFLSNYKQS